MFRSEKLHNHHSGLLPATPNIWKCQLEREPYPKNVSSRWCSEVTSSSSDKAD
jgi:hypothetical protein